jgi:hypothetical protein
VDFRQRQKPWRRGKNLHQLWGEVDALAKTIYASALLEARTAIDLMALLDNRYSWIGVADVDGSVLAAANGLLERESVAQRPWFRRGLNGPTAIDVHEAQLLAKLLPARTEPYRFIDLAAPIDRARAAANAAAQALTSRFGGRLVSAFAHAPLDVCFWREVQCPVVAHGGRERFDRSRN